MTQPRHRQGDLERRLHRPFALFTVLQCWMRGLDGVIFRKEDLLRILGLKKIIKTDTRLEWLKEDLGEYFDFVQEVMLDGKTNKEGQLNSLLSFWVSGRPFPLNFWDEVMPDEERLKKLPLVGPRIAFFKIWPEASSPDIPRTTPDAALFLGKEGNYDEKLLASYLSLLCQGIISPQSVPCFRPDSDSGFFTWLRRDKG